MRYYKFMCYLLTLFANEVWSRYVMQAARRTHIQRDSERHSVSLAIAYITIAIRLRYDYDKKLTFFFCRRRIGSRRARYIVVS